MAILEKSKLILHPDGEEANRLLNNRNLTEYEIEKRLEEVKCWLKESPHLPDTFDEKLLRGFVSIAKTLDRGKEKVEKYCEYKSSKNFLSDRDPSSQWFKNNNTQLCCVPLPQPTEDGARLLYMAGMQPKFSYSSKHRAQFVSMIIELLLQEDHPSVNSYGVVVDCKNLGPSFILQLSPMIEKELVQYLQMVMPYRIAGAWMFNTGPIIAKMFAYLIKPLLSKKIQERIHLFSGGIECLDGHIPVELLPKDLGGQQPSSEQLSASWRQMCEDNSRWFLTEANKEIEVKKKPKNGSYSFSVISSVCNKIWSD